MGGGLEGFRDNPRFDVGKRIGAGGMGVVYRAFDRERGHWVALKTLEIAEGEALYRFKLEFRAIAELSHTNLVSLYDLFVDRATAFFTMELIDGTDFVTWCRRRRDDRNDAATDSAGCDHDTDAIEEATTQPPAMPFFERGVWEALPQLIRGLAALHAGGRVHRDIKSSNVLVDRDGRVVLLDFRLVTGAGLGGQTGRQIVGTLDTMAPEQARPLGRVTPAADIYGAGVMLYEILTGFMPFSGCAADILVAKSELDPPLVQAICPEVPAELARLCEAMMRRDPSRRPTANQLLRELGRDPEPEHSVGGSGAAAGGAFCGRAAELATMQTLLARAASAPVAVRLSGRSGIGKSELFREFTSRLLREDRAAIVLSGRCFERESLRYRGIDSLVDDLSRTWNELPAAEAAALVPELAGALQRLFPVLSRVPALARATRPLSIADPAELRRLGFDALREVLSRLSARRQVVLFIDDAQWVDRDTVLLLADVMRTPGAPSVLLVLAERDDPSVPVSDDLAELFESLSIEVCELTMLPLSRIESVELARRLLDPHRRGLAQLVAREATGHPLFLVELASFINSGGDDRGDSIYQIRLSDLIVMRLRDLSDDSRMILESICVAGEPIEQGVIRTATQIDGESLHRELQLLLSARLVRTGGRGSGDLVEPYHDQIRETAVAELDESRRGELHRNLALALERSGAGEAHGALARHWLAAGEGSRALAYALRAARDAFDQLDFERAAELYRFGLSIGGLSDGERQRTRAVVGAALANAGRPWEAAQAFRDAADGQDPAVGLDLRRRAAEQLMRGGYLADGLAAFEDVLTDIGMSVPGSRRRAVAALIWLRTRLRLRGWRYQLRQEGEIPADELTRVDVCWSLGSSLATLDPLFGSIFHLRGLLAALEVGERRRLGRAVAFHAVLLAVAGSPQAPDRLALARRIGESDSYVAAYATLAEMADCYFVRSEWARVLERFDELRAALTSEHATAGWEIDSARTFVCCAQLFLGDLRELSRAVAEVRSEAGRRGARFAAEAVRARLVAVFLMNDDADGGSRDLLELTGQLSPGLSGYTVHHFYALHSRCEVELYRGDAAGAQACLAEAWPLLQQSQFLRLPRLASELRFLAGRIALAGRDQQALAVAIRQLRRIDHGLSGPLCELLAAGGAGLAGDRARAIAHLRRATNLLADSRTRLFELPARWRLGELTAGADGDAMRRAAEEELRADGVVAPGRWVDLMLPGW